VIWRVGRKVGRTIYRQTGSEPSDDDELIGVMDTPELAELAVAAVNDREEPMLNQSLGRHALKVDQ
jgi:hypothetical protein